MTSPTVFFSLVADFLHFLCFLSLFLGVRLPSFPPLPTSSCLLLPSPHKIPKQTTPLYYTLYSSSSSLLYSLFFFLDNRIIGLVFLVEPPPLISRPPFPPALLLHSLLTPKPTWPFNFPTLFESLSPPSSFTFLS